MRIVINVLLFLLSIGLVYVLAQNIRQPIHFQKERSARTERVVEKLKQIRTAQEAYRDITGKFAGSFDELANVLNSEKFAIVSVIGDPDDPNFTGKITYDTLFRPAKDSMLALGIDVNTLQYVPGGDNATFDIKADTLTYQSTLTHVVEVKTKYKTFLQEFDAKYALYDKKYNPESEIKFGNLQNPVLSGNWE